MVSYQIFTQSAQDSSILFGGHHPSHSLAAKFQLGHRSLHSAPSPGCLLRSAPCFHNHVWQRTKAHNPIHGKLRVNPDGFGFIGGAELRRRHDFSNPNTLSQPFTLLFGNVFFAFFYLALAFHFHGACRFGFNEDKKIT